MKIKELKTLINKFRDDIEVKISTCGNTGCAGSLDYHIWSDLENKMPVLVFYPKSTKGGANDISRIVKKIKEN